jgi:DNA-binding transcriptional MerR regulator
VRIAEVADRAGVSVRALRSYEEQGLLRACRSPGGRRRHPDTAVGRVRLIRQLNAAGLPGKAVRRVPPCADSGEASPELPDRLTAERARIDQRITGLLAARDRLDVVIALTQDPDADCSPMR